METSDSSLAQNCWCKLVEPRQTQSKEAQLPLTMVSLALEASLALCSMRECSARRERS